MEDIILKVENLSKQYRLGTVGTGTLGHDLNRAWHRIRGKEDPYLMIGAVNDRSATTTSDYVWALKDVNFEVKRGEILGIIGKNGAGKSTLLKILSRVTSPSTGSIKTKGRIASLLEVGTGMHPELTGLENIYLNGAILGMTKAEIRLKIDEIVVFSGCQMYIDTPVKRYSSGMRVRLGFAVAAFLEPDILVVDEVLAVGDAEFQKKAIGKMQDISSSGGRTVLFVSHNMASVQSLCTRVVVLENGGIKFDGNVETAIQRYMNNIDYRQLSSVMLGKSHRRDKVSQEIEMTEISLKNQELTTRDDLVFNIFFKKNEFFDKSISVTGSICSLDGTRLGSFFNDLVTIKPTTGIIELIVPRHNLATGRYYINVAINTGSLGLGNLKMIDQAYQAISFELLKEKAEGNYILDWNPSWGKFYFESNLIIR